MFMPKEHRVAIYSQIFKEGVLVAQKDLYGPEHPELKDIPMLHVIKTMKSLKSQKYVKEQFAWRHSYWFLTNEGIEYLRNYLKLPQEAVPTTHMYSSAPRRTGVPAGARPAKPRADGGDRSTYRRMERPGVGDKKADAGAGAGNPRMM